MNRGYIYILITAIAFSTMEIAAKTIANQINPFQMLFIRFCIGGLFLLPFAVAEIRRRKLKLGWGDFLFFTLTGTVGIVLSMSFFQQAIFYTKASVVAVIFSTNAIFTIPLARVILKEKLTPSKIISIGVSIVGVIFIFNPFGAGGDVKGMAYAFISAICFSLFGIIGKTRLERYGGLILNSFSFIMGNMVLLAGILCFKIPVLAGVNLGNLPQLLYLGIFVTGVGYLCYFLAMKHTSAITASMVFFIKPAIAPVLSLILIHETITVNVWLGILCIIGAAGLMFAEGRKAVRNG